MDADGGLAVGFEVQSSKEILSGIGAKGKLN